MEGTLDSLVFLMETDRVARVHISASQLLLPRRKMRFKKSEGLTASERVLADLCDHSFLELWTYPNLFKRPGKELADLIVIFRNDVLIFSDKSCNYPSTGEELLDWQRWSRAAIRKSAHQIHEAQKWIRNQPSRVFLDARCLCPLPIEFPDQTLMRVHRICVVTGAAQRSLEVTGRSTLAIDLDVFEGEKPFTLGRQASDESFFHVFDDYTLKRVLIELDTVGDFIQYLAAKEEAMTPSGHLRGAASEEDLLAYYLWHNRSFPSTTEPYVVTPDQWTVLSNNSAFQAGKEENKISYLWDGLIQNVIANFIEENFEHGNDVTVAQFERLARIMASERRFHRRILSKAILTRANRARSGKIGSLLPSSQENVVYTLLIGKGASKLEYKAYQQDRSRELYLRCIAAKATRPECRFIVGIALDALGVSASSEDLIFVDTLGWTRDTLEKADCMRRELRFFVPGIREESSTHEDEYPER